MIVGDDFESIKRTVEDLKRKRDKAKGALDQVMKRNRKEFGVKTIEELAALHKKEEAEERKKGETYFKVKKGFDKRWKKKLGRL